jgi:uncharacterized membrane protein YphA (DoxX/SURF4 family)
VSWSKLGGVERTAVTAPVAARARWWRAWLDWGGTVARVGLAAVWAWAGFAKLADPAGAVLSVRAYRLLPEVLVRPVAWGLPFLELAVAVLLVTGIATRLAAGSSAGLLVVFMLGIAAAWARGLQIHCGCFSAGGPDAAVGAAQYLGALLRDGGLLLVSAYLIWRPQSRLALVRSSPSQRSPENR